MSNLYDKYSVNNFKTLFTFWSLWWLFRKNSSKKMSFLQKIYFGKNTNISCMIINIVVNFYKILNSLLKALRELFEFPFHQAFNKKNVRFIMCLKIFSKSIEFAFNIFVSRSIKHFIHSFSFIRDPRNENKLF